MRFCACATLALALFAAPSALAQDADSSPDHAAAQEAHRHALDLFDHGQYAEALAEFKRAYTLAPSFRIQYNVGLSQVALGDAVGAVEAFGAYLREGGDRIPAQRRTQVEAEVARLSKQLAWLNLDVDEPGSDITLDGAPLGRGPFSQQLRLSQGKHTVAVRSSDGTLKTQTVQLSGGQDQRLRFDAQHGTAVAPATEPSAPADVAPKPQRSIPWVAWGVTGALGAGTAVTGILALSAHSDERDKQTRQGVTGAELRDAHDKVKSLALVTDVLLVGTAVAAGVSLYLTLKQPSGSREPSAALVVGPGSLQLRGSF